MVKKCILFRFDDISWDMNYEMFCTVRDLFLSSGVKPIIGVIPDNRDPKLKSYSGITPEKFWEEIRSLQSEHGWTVALHGYEHVYCTEDGGLFNVSSKSEFAGLSYPEQAEKIRKGKEILETHGVRVDCFMAPSHSFDWSTVRALRENGIRYITDGYSSYPYRRKGVWFIPQVRPWLKKSGIGIDTVCFHFNDWNEKYLAVLKRSLADPELEFVTFSEVLDLINTHSSLQWSFCNFFSKPYYALWNFIRLKRFCPGTRKK